VRREIGRCIVFPRDDLSSRPSGLFLPDQPEPPVLNAIAPVRRKDYRGVPRIEQLNGPEADLHKRPALSMILRSLSQNRMA
jgi:hypothetical protein